MALSIRNPEVEELARRLSEGSGLGMTEEIYLALKERARVAVTGRSRLQRILAFKEACTALPDLESRTPEEILGYGDEGLPNGR